MVTVDIQPPTVRVPGTQYVTATFTRLRKDT
jgi:hypothetical protein